jgi:hypothetical protein
MSATVSLLVVDDGVPMRAYGSESMSLGGSAWLSCVRGVSDTNRIFRGNSLRWHVRPLLDVRHLGWAKAGPMAVPSEVHDVDEPKFTNVVSSELRSAVVLVTKLR